MARKPTDTVHLKLRFPESLRRQLQRAAGRNERSMNSEIMHRLNESFAKLTEAGLQMLERRHGALREALQQARSEREELQRRGDPISKINEKLDRILAFLGAAEAEKTKHDGDQK